MKRFAIGFIAAFMSILVVHYAMAAIYLLLGKPFYGSLIAGCIYSFVQGSVGAVLCQLGLIKFVDERLATATTKIVGVVYAVVLAAGSAWALWSGTFQEIPSILPTVALALPWLLLGFALRRPVFRQSEAD